MWVLSLTNLQLYLIFFFSFFFLATNDDHSKIDIKIQTNCEFSKTIGELYESIAHRKLPNGSLKPNACILSACDENEEQNTDDNEEERNERILVEVQESLERQIRELEQTEIDVDTETDETDCEVQLEEQDDGVELGSGDDSAVFVTMSLFIHCSHTYVLQEYINFGPPKLASFLVSLFFTEMVPKSWHYDHPLQSFAN